jgi:hypothetical protein
MKFPHSHSELSLNSPVLFTSEQHRNQNLNHTVDMQPVIVISYHSLIQTAGWRPQQVSLCSWQKEDISVFSKLPGLTPGPTHPTQRPIQCVSRGSFSGENWPGHEADRSLPSSAEIKNGWSCTSAPHRSSGCVQDGLGCSLVFCLKKGKVQLYTTKTLHVVLYRYKTWSVTLKGEKAGEWIRTKTLRRKSGPKKKAYWEKCECQCRMWVCCSGLFWGLIPHSVVGRYQHVGEPWCFLCTVEGRTVPWLIKW